MSEHTNVPEVDDYEESDGEDSEASHTISPQFLADLVQVSHEETRKAVWNKWLVLVQNVVRNGLSVDTTEEDIELAARFLGVSLETDNNGSSEPYNLRLGVSLDDVVVQSGSESDEREVSE